MSDLVYKFNGRKLRTLVANSGVVSHPFFKIIAREAPEAREALKAFATEDYLVAKGFAQFLAHLISLVDDTHTRMLLVGNLWDEHGLGNPDEIHFELYKRLLASLGVPQPTSKTGQRADFLQLHYDIAAENVTCGIAIFTYANEFLSMIEFSKVRAACKLNFPSVDERYFETNQKADIVHTEQLELALARLVTTESEELLVQNSITRALESREAFYSKIIGQ